MCAPRRRAQAAQSRTRHKQKERFFGKLDDIAIKTLRVAVFFSSRKKHCLFLFLKRKDVGRALTIIAPKAHFRPRVHHRKSGCPRNVTLATECSAKTKLYCNGEISLNSQGFCASTGMLDFQQLCPRQTILWVRERPLTNYYSSAFGTPCSPQDL